MPQNYLATGFGEWGQVLVEAYSGEDCYTVCFATCNFLSEVLLYYQQKKKKCIDMECYCFMYHFTIWSEISIGYLLALNFPQCSLGLYF